MTQTEAYVRDRLPSDLASITLAYFHANERTPYVIAEAGEYEECERMYVDDADVDSAAEGACAGGHIELASLMIERGATSFDTYLGVACYRGQKESMLLMIAHGADDWNEGLFMACEGGCLASAIEMIERGADDINNAFWSACMNENAALMELLRDRGATSCSCGRPIAGHFAKCA